MTKKVKVLSIAGVVIILGIGGFIGYKKYSEVQPTVKAQELVQNVCTLGEITRIEYQSDDSIILENQEGKWINTKRDNLSYDQALMQDWVTSLQTLETKKVLKNVPDLSIYGIDEESTMITLYDSADHVQMIKLGNIIESEDSMYIQCDEEEKLYVVSYESAKDLLVRPNDFVDCADVLQIPELQSIEIDYKDKVMHLIKEEQWYLEEYYAIEVTLKEESITKFIKAIEEMQIMHYVGTYAELETYGLDSPRLTLVLNDEIKIAFGSQNRKNIYVSINDGQDVYTINQAFYTTLTGLKPFDVMEKQVIQLEMDKVDEVTLSNPQGTYVLRFNDSMASTEAERMIQEENAEGTVPTEVIVQDNASKAEVTVQDNTSASETEVTAQDNASTSETEATVQDNESANGLETTREESVVATLNEKTLTQVEAEDWFARIKQSLWIEALLQNPSIEQKEERKAEAVISFKLKDGSEVVAELIPYDINYYILRYNGTIEFAVNKDKITKLFNEITHFVKK